MVRDRGRNYWLEIPQGTTLGFATGLRG